jgi:two-component system secretion response regulator SsrB
MRVVVIDQQPLFQEGVKATLAVISGVSVVGAAGHAREGLRLVDARSPDVVVVDLALPGMSGLALIRELRRRQPELRVLAMCATCREREMLDAFAAGACGFMAKTDPPEAFIEGVQAVGRGQRFVGPVARALARAEQADAAARADALKALSRRERDVFDLIVKGFRNREMARELCISTKTVETHRLHINRKLDCAGSIDLLRFALANRLVSWSDDPTTRADGLDDGSETVLH